MTELFVHQDCKRKFMADGDRALISLLTFVENDAAAVITSPRSLHACKIEGVSPKELIFKPQDAFQEKNLSPRLANLRFSFFEAKRHDLLAATRRTREKLISEDGRDKDAGCGSLDVISKHTGLSMGAFYALNSDGLKIERQNLLRAQENERLWLQNALNHEVNMLKTLEKDDATLSATACCKSDKASDAAALRAKELNDRRMQDEERKARESEAKLKLEKQLATEEFQKKQQDIAEQKEFELEKQKDLYERQIREINRKRQVEIAREGKKQELWTRQQERVGQMQAQDVKRGDILDQQRQVKLQGLRNKKGERDARVQQSVEKNTMLERQRRQDYEDKQERARQREERVAFERALQLEETAKQSFQQMMRRRLMQETAARKHEDRVATILENQEHVEQRLLGHEGKKERYLDFKRELDTLRLQNKEFNVKRQRRKEDNHREEVAEKVRTKEEKMEAMAFERQRLWEIRRQAQAEAHRTRQDVKQQILHQMVRSKFNARVVEASLDSALKNDFLQPTLITCASAPTLRPASR